MGPCTLARTGRLPAAFSHAAVLAARPSSALAGAAVELASSWTRRFMKDAHEFGGVPVTVLAT
jgi:hypothetical protein